MSSRKFEYIERIKRKMRYRQERRLAEREELEPVVLKARKALLNAVSEIAPYVPENLEKLLDRHQETVVVHMVTDFELAGKQARHFGSIQMLLSDVTAWAECWNLGKSDKDWMLRVALQTLFEWASSGEADRRFHWKPDDIYPESYPSDYRDVDESQHPFPPARQYNVWWDFKHDKEADFKRREVAQFKHFLDRYISEVKFLSEDKALPVKPQTFEVAQWFAFYQTSVQKPTFDELATRFFKDIDERGNMRRACLKFSELVGLPMRLA